MQTYILSENSFTSDKQAQNLLLLCFGNLLQRRLHAGKITST